MKTLQKLILVLIVVGFTSCYSQRTQVNARNNEQISFQTFYNELAPYGQWVEDYDHGYLWIPHVNRNFQPYASDGYWTMTNYGNTWVSDYSWGWAPFHYGRWIRDDFLGWAWIPGYEWAPAWVSWRSGGGQYGWAPMGPRMGVNININIPWSHWTFLPQRHMYGRNMHRYYNRGNRNYYNQTTIINNTNIYNNNTYYSGPSAGDVERSTGRRVSVRNVTNSGRSGRTSVSDRSVNMYRPEVTRNSGRTERPESAPNRSSVNRGSTNSGRTSGSSNRSTNVDRNTNTPQNTRNSGTVNRSNQTRQDATESNRTNSTNRGSGVNQSTQRQTLPTRNNSATVNRSNETNRGTVNRSNATTNQTRTGTATVNSRSTTKQPAPTRQAVTRQAAPTRSATTNTRSNSSVSTSRSRGTAAQSATRSSSNANTKENTTTRSSSSRSGRGR